MAPDPRLDPAVAQSRAAAGELRVGGRALFLGRAHFGCVATVLPDVSRGLSKQVTSISVLSCRPDRPHFLCPPCFVY